MKPQFPALFEHMVQFKGVLLNIVVGMATNPKIFMTVIKKYLYLINLM